MPEGKNVMARRVLAGIGVAALSATGIATIAAAAPGPDQPGVPDGGSLTIHKYLGNTEGPHDGTELDTAPDLNPAEGVTFTLQRIGFEEGGECAAIDLGDAQGWEAAQEIIPNPELGCDVQGAVSATTDATGEAVFDGLDLGLYYVTETDLGANEGNIIQPIDPFFVTVPYPNEGDWIYDVHVYPKNATGDAPTKSIDEGQGDFALGATVSWTIDATVPSLNDKDFDSASVYDVLDPRLEYVSSTVRIGGVELGPEAFDFTNDGGNLTWTFTTAGLGILDANQGESLTVELLTKVIGIGADGAIANSDYGVTFDDTTIPGTSEPHTYWGALEIAKVDEAGAALAGAQFQVFEKTGEQCPAQAPENGAVSTGVSNDSGEVIWNLNDLESSATLGLWVANASDGAADPEKDYCVYETAVPAGYTGGEIANPITITPGSDNAIDLTVINVQQSGPDLPLTGSSGTLIMTVGGVALMLIAAGVYAVSRRKANESSSPGL